MISYNVKKGASNEEKKRRPTANTSALDFSDGSRRQDTQTSGDTAGTNGINPNGEVWQKAVSPQKSAEALPKNYASKIKSMITPEVQTRNYTLKYGEGNGFSISDEDIQYKDGNVYVRGVNIGKPDRVDEDGVSYMSEERLKTALDAIKQSQGGGVNGYDAQYDRVINQNIGMRDTQAKQDGEMTQKAFDWYRTDPLGTDYGKQVMATYGALGKDDAANAAASSGTGANTDSASLAAMTAAQEARKLAGINAVTAYWAAAGEGQRGVMNDAAANRNNYITAGTDMATAIKDNQRADADMQNQTNEIDAKITGRVPLDTERRNNGFYYKDPVTGEFKLYYGGENVDYSALANEAETKGDLETANRLREAAEHKGLTNANYADKINSLVPSQRADTNDRYESGVAQSEAQKDRDFQKETMQLESKLNEKQQNNELSQAYLDNIFKLAYEDAANSGNYERLNRLAQWMNAHGYAVPENI